MAAIGGPIKGVSIAGREFSSASDSPPKMFIGGAVNKKEPNGDQSARTIQEIKPWSVSDVKVSVDLSRGDIEFLQDLSDNGSDEVFTVTYTDGTVYQGRGGVVGELNYDAGKATVDVGFEGPGKLTPQ